MKLSKLLEHIVNVTVSGIFDSQMELANITSDSREKNINGIFVAVKGLNSDGALFAQQAINNGAKVVVSESCIMDKKDGICYIQVENSREIQGEIAARLYDFPGNKMQTIGITGTNGKTSFCYILRHILNNAGKKCGLFGNIEYDLGKEKVNPRLNTPEAIELQKCLSAMVGNSCTDMVMEVSSHGLALGRVNGLLFDRAVFSNLTQDHLDFHGNLQNYADSKALLFNRYLKKDGMAIINEDDGKADLFKSASVGKVLTYGKSKASDLFILNYTYNQRGLVVDYNYQGEKFSIVSNLEGSFQVYNLTAAVLTALSYGISINQIQVALSTDLTIPGRLEQINCGMFTIFVDYAHTPDAMEKAIAALKDLSYSKLTVVFGCGGNRDKTKRAIMGKMACSMADSVILTSDNPRTEEPLEIIRDIVSGLAGYNNYRIIENRETAIHSAMNSAIENEIILIAGKGHENYQEIKGIKHPFSDQQEVLKHLEKMRISHAEN